MTQPDDPTRSSAGLSRLLLVGFGIGALLAVALVLRFGSGASESGGAEPIAALPATAPTDPGAAPEERPTARPEPAGDTRTASSEPASEVADTAADPDLATAPDVSSAPAATIAPDPATAPVVATADAAPDDAAPDDAAPDDAAPDDAAPDDAAPADAAPADAAPDVAAAAPMLDIDASDLQGLAELAALTTLSDADSGATLPSVDDPVASDLFGSRVVLVSSAVPRVVVLANGASLVPGAVLPSGHRLVDIERERILLERDGVEWRLRVP